MTPFLDACGATGPLHWTLEAQGSGSIERITLDQPHLVLGRHPESDIQLPHPDVSERHAYLQLVDGRLFLVDLGSRLGISVDGRRLRSGWVGRGSTIRIGPYRIRLTGGDRGPSVEQSTRPTLALELSHRSIRSSACSIADELSLIGSAADCHARLLDSSVSDFHCALVHSPSGSWVIDLLGRGGLFINGTRSKLGLITEGNELRIGDSLVRFPSPRPIQTESPASGELAVISPLVSGLAPELADSLLTPLAQHFLMTQQQMFDRIQQAEQERFRALAEFQSEQFGILREELEQLRELRQEIDDMRAELKVGGRQTGGRDRSPSRARLGSASTPASSEEPPALNPPEGPSVIRMSLGEAS